MSFGLVFWILMLLWLVFSIAWNNGWAAFGHGPIGNSLFLFALFVLLGWRVFGAPIHG